MTAILAIFKLVPSWLLAILLALAVATAGVERVQRDHARSVLSTEQKARATETAQREALALKAETEARAKEQAWQAAADATTKAKDEQIQNIHARLDSALISLRNRPQRPAVGSVVPQTACAAIPATGAGLYRDDSEFLSRLASSAAVVVAERNDCYAKYNAVRATAGR